MREEIPVLVVIPVMLVWMVFRVCLVYPGNPVHLVNVENQA